MLPYNKWILLLGFLTIFSTNSVVALDFFEVIGNFLKGTVRKIAYDTMKCDMDASDNFDADAEQRGKHLLGYHGNAKSRICSMLENVEQKMTVILEHKEEGENSRTVSNVIASFDMMAEETFKKNKAQIREKLVKVDSKRILEMEQIVEEIAGSEKNLKDCAVKLIQYLTKILDESEWLEKEENQEKQQQVQQDMGHEMDKDSGEFQRLANIYDSMLVTEQLKQLMMKKEEELSEKCNSVACHQLASPLESPNANPLSPKANKRRRRRKRSYSYINPVGVVCAMLMFVICIAALVGLGIVVFKFFIIPFFPLIVAGFAIGLGASIAACCCWPGRR